MSKVIQILSHNSKLIALTDDGEIFVLENTAMTKWRSVEGPLPPTPPRFSDPLEYDPPTVPKPILEPEDSPDFNSLNGPGQGVYRSRFQKPKPRRPTSIGPDGNYVQPLGD